MIIYTTERIGHTERRIYTERRGKTDREDRQRGEDIQIWDSQTGDTNRREKQDTQSQS